MSYFILMGRRIPKQAITGFKFQNETDNIRPFLSILFFVDDEYAGTVKLTNLDNGESNISFPSCDDGLIINPADKHIK